MQLDLLLRRLQRILDKLVDAGAGVAALLHFGQHHGMRDAHTRRQLLGNRFDELVERVLVPVHEVLGRTLLLDLLELLRIAGSFHLGLVVLNLVLGSLGYDHALGIEARAACATGDLMELTAAQAAHLATVELSELREHHRVDGHVDTDA